MGCGFILLRIFVCLVSVGTAALLVFHVFPHCSVEAEGMTIPLCNIDALVECRPAFTISTEVNEGGIKFKYSISCPWSPITVVVGLLGMSASSFLYIALCCCLKKATCKVFTLILNGVTILFFLISSIMMIVDISKGSSYFNELTQGIEGASQKQLTYIINLVLGLITTLGFIAIFYVAYKTKSDSHVVKIPGMNHSRIEIPNTSQSGHQPSGQKMGWNETYEDSRTQGNNNSFQQYSGNNVMQHQGHGNRNASPQRGGQQQMHYGGGQQNHSPNARRNQQGQRNY